ncbi:amino acid/amide ABC transporter substrate-binding protein (HAAT family) [Ornithinicoccus hortensis]|uniref:Amino acid/amide ABC transporter substrate-binding protein (HAAT family) n=1 Tax=Ornithinicoccus hortensis TaxID=82346 RepID=A0A542YSK2_9MICO|nr:amino acid/amide ABC transporter substrate-binding protein (HAAT family) [Ornithinicoccus hortensis]
MRRKRHLKAVAALSAIALVAACGGTDDEGDDETSQEQTTDEGADDGAGDTGDEAEETEGSDEAAPPPADAPADFTLGYVLPETGQLAPLGPPQFAGVGLAIQDINDAGGVLGAQVPDAIAGDEAGQDSVAQASADRILGEGVSGIIGAAASGMSLAIVDRVTGAGVMQCSGSNTAPTFTDLDDNGLYIRTAPSDALQGPVLANLIVEDGWTNVALVARADDYGQGLADATASSLENAGASVALNETYDPNATNFDGTIQAVVSANPDAVVVIGFEEGEQILQGLIEEGFGPSEVGVYTTDGLRNPDLANSIGGGDPTVLAGLKGTAPASAENADFLASLAEFAPDLGDNTQFAPQVYDCVVTMALAAEAAGSADPEDFKAEVVNVTRDGEVCTSYEECKGMIADGVDIDYDGVSGPLDFVDAGEPGKATIEIYGFNDAGEFESIDSVESNPAEE